MNAAAILHSIDDITFPVTGIADSLWMSRPFCSHGKTPRDDDGTGPLAAQTSAFAAILLFPLRAIERARGWRRLALLLLYVLIALPILALLWRRSQLAGLPDVGEPFDASGARGPPPECPTTATPSSRIARRPSGSAT